VALSQYPAGIMMVNPIITNNQGMRMQARLMVIEDM
jgi:hypothetical protein